jgi:DNA-binding PadR family transcriptional regulator
MSDKPLTTLEYGLLGLVGMAPMSGYDVHKVFETTPLAHFSSSPGAIYTALRRLERRGLLGARLDRTTEARPRRVYSLSEAGDAALLAWLREPVTREGMVRDAGAPILRFSLMQGRLSPQEVITYLEGYRRVVKSYLEELRGYLPDVRADNALHARLSLERGISGYKSDVDWIEHAIAVFKRKQRGARRRRASR